jgi:hypothetical protein
MKSVFAILLVIGYIVAALAFVCGLGYGFYLLGVVELTFGQAAWGGFLLWAKVFFGGLLACIVGGIGTAAK